MTIQSLGYIGVNCTDVGKWSDYGTKVLGMEDVTKHLNDGTKNVYLKMDDRPFRIMAMPADTNGYAFSGWEAANKEDLEISAAKLKAAGIEITSGTTEEKSRRRVQDLIKFQDPCGNNHELYWGTISDFRHLVSPAGVSGFVTGELGLGHTVLPAPNFDAAIAFYTQVLNFELSDFMNIRFTPDPKEPAKRLWFLHCNERHHSLGLFEIESPVGCIHTMVEVEDMDEVGLANDRRIANQVPLTATLGRHANDHMISFYMSTPSGFDMEWGAGGRVVENWASYNVFESTVASFWGHDFSVGRQDPSDSA